MTESRWWKWLERENVPALYAIMRHHSHPYRKEFKDFTGTYLRPFFVYEKGTLHIWWNKDDSKIINEKLVSGARSGSDYMQQIEERHFTLAEKLNEHSKTFTDADFSKKSDEELKEYLDEYASRYSDLTMYTCLAIICTFGLEEILEPYLKDKLKENGLESKYGEYFTILAHHEGKSWTQLQEEDLESIAEKVRSKSISEEEKREELKRHQSEYYWHQHAYQFLAPPLPLEHFENQLEEFVKSPPTPLPTEEEIQAKRKKIIEELEIDIEHDRLFDALGHLVYLKEFRDGIYTRSHSQLNRLIKELLERNNIPEETGWFMMMQDYQKLAAGEKLDMENLEARKELFVWMYDDKEYLPVGVEAQELIKKEVGELKPKAESVQVIKGVVASPGFAKGIAKVLHNESEISKIEDGEIIIAYMTKPSYLPAMKKAAAFVTDEGGVTCHAALVSREMRKPCLIATKIATEVLKDGMEVEVDCNNGEVRVV